MVTRTTGAGGLEMTGILEGTADDGAEISAEMVDVGVGAVKIVSPTTVNGPLPSRNLTI